MLDLKKHCFQSEDGRHWSNQAQADFVDKKISQVEMNILTLAYWEGASKFFVPKGGRLR